jgi:hypothetical protein
MLGVQDRYANEAMQWWWLWGLEFACNFAGLRRVFMLPASATTNNVMPAVNSAIGRPDPPFIGAYRNRLAPKLLQEQRWQGKLNHGPC